MEKRYSLSILLSIKFYVAILLCPCVVIYPENNHGYTYCHEDKKNGYSGSDSE